MTAAQPHFYPAPFDAVATAYDAIFTSSWIGRAQRAVVWNELKKAFCSGDRVLEIGCGTGVDACFLAERGVRVMASDSSRLMIETATRRIERLGLGERVQPVLLRAEDIGTLPSERLLDGAFSNFGALNCVADLRLMARELAAMLKPGANVVLCWMGPSCAWEMIWYLASANRKKAFRRLRRGGVTSSIAEGPSFIVRYPSIRMLTGAFAPEFSLQSIRGVGVCVPPSYAEAWAARHPLLFKLCEYSDRLVGKCPGIRALGDHVLVRLQRRATAPQAVER
jgi:ubiquinone/menaquinone biosynthesis C-methylase UbiE